ncbi:MAG: efflux RND transporter periplasmic adaptor subunit [Candidatus Aminicenantes bacterium]|nr:efflux RND transporter periplasmic adaptor subunit [Candidatus Aminicenantes bacterium]
MKQLIFILLVSVIMLIGCGNRGDEQTVLEKKPVKVKMIKVRSGEFSKFLPYQGTVSPWKKANIAPNTSGRIWKIYKKQGDMVTKGTLLAELDTTTLKLQLKQAEAALEVARAGYKDARLNHSRLKKLHERKAVSQMRLEKALLALEAADTQKKSAEANLNVVKHTLDNSYMRAPFDGIITSKNMEEGDMINPMMGMGASVLTLMDLKKVKVVLDVASEDIEKIQIGQFSKAVFTNLENDTFTGEVYTKNLAADPVSKTFRVEIKIENPEIRIKAGVFAEIMIEIFHQDNAMMLPLDALIDNQYVVLYDEGKAKKVEIEIGERNQQEFVVVKGLSVGQEVVVEGHYDLKDGALIAREGAMK